MTVTATPASSSEDDVHGYISDMLAQLADMAGDAGSDRLERSLRLLALEAAADGVGGAARRRGGGRRD